VGGAVGTAARRPALAGQLVIVIAELGGGVAALQGQNPRKTVNLLMICTALDPSCDVTGSSVALYTRYSRT
jgi:hypothetical protein